MLTTRHWFLDQIFFTKKSSSWNFYFRVKHAKKLTKHKRELMIGNCYFMETKLWKLLCRENICDEEKCVRVETSMMPQRDYVGQALPRKTKKNTLLLVIKAFVVIEPEPMDDYFRSFISSTKSIWRNTISAIEWFFLPFLSFCNLLSQAWYFNNEKIMMNISTHILHRN